MQGEWGKRLYNDLLNVLYARSLRRANRSASRCPNRCRQTLGPSQAFLKHAVKKKRKMGTFAMVQRTPSRLPKGRVFLNVGLARILQSGKRTQKAHDSLEYKSSQLNRLPLLYTNPYRTNSLLIELSWLGRVNL